MRILIALLSCALLVGCSSSTPGNKPAGGNTGGSKSAPVGGEPLGLTGGEENAGVLMNVREMNDMAKRSVELLGFFSSNDPRDWDRARRELRMIGKPFVPDDVEGLLKITEGKDPNKASLARLELARRGKIARVLQKLDSKKFSDWQAARSEIQRMGGDAIQYLIVALIHEFKGLKTLRYEWARKELVTIGDPARPYLLGYLQAADADPVLKDQCSATLAMMGTSGKAEFEKALESDNKWSRVAVAKGIAANGSPDLVPILTRLLAGDIDWEVRAEAAISLGKMKAKSAVPALVTALQEADEMVQRQSAKALGDIGATEAVSDLIAVIEREPSTRLSDWAVTALQKITGQKYGNEPAAWRAWWTTRSTR